MKTNTAFPTLLATSLLRRVVFPLLALLSVSSVAFAQNGVFSWAGLGSGNQDANVGLTNTKTYLNAVDAGGWGGTVNGVTFARGNFNSNPSGSNYAVTGAGSTFFRDPINLRGELGKVVLDFVYGSGSSTQTVTLSGLTAGEFYTTTFYNYAWDNNSRAQAITTTGGASTTFNQNFNGQNNANVLRYGFVASGTNEAITFTPVNAGATFHNSAFTTEQAFNKTYVSGGDWTTAAWSTAGAPNAVGANADFTAQAAPTTLNLNAAQTVGNLRFAGTNGWTVSGSNTLTLQADVGGRAILAATSGTHTIATPTDWSSDLWVSGAGRLELSGQVGTTSRGLTKSGVGTLVLSGSNAFSGVTDITAGTLVAANNAALGAGGHDQSKMTWIRDGATLALQGNISSGEHFHVWGSGVGGLGAIRNLSGNNALTNVDGSGPGYALRSQTTVGVDAGSLSVSGFYESGGSYGLTTIGAGTLILTANSTYTGTTTISGGTLQVGNGGTNGTLGTGAVTNNASLVFNRANALAVANVISGTGSVAQNGAGVTTLAASNTYTGGTTVNAGTLALGAANRLADSGAVTVNAGSFDLGGFSETVGAVTLAGGSITNGTLTGSSYDMQSGSVSAALAGNAALTKSTASTVTLSASNTYAGGTTVNAGTLALGAANRLADSGAVTVNAGSFDLGGFSETVGAVTLAGGSITNGTLTGSSYDMQSGSVSAALAGNAALTKSTASTVTLSASNTYAGGTTVNAGTLATAGSQRLADTGAVTVNSNATFAIGGDETIGSLSGSGAVELGGRLTTGASNSTYSGSMSGLGGLTKSGAGTFTLSGASTYTGDTILAAGTLVLNNANALWTGGVLSMDAGTTLTVNQRTFIGALDQNGGTIDGSGQLVATLTLTESGALNAVLADGPDFAAGILKRTSGTTTIGAANTFTGGINVQGGTLQLGAGGSFDAASSLALSSGATMDLGNKAQTFSAVSGAGGTVALGSGALTVAGSGNSEFAGAITGTGSFTKGGSGTVTLSGTSTYSGDTVVNAGELKVNGSIASSEVTVNSGAVLSGSGTVGGISGAGSINPGNSPGILTAPWIDPSDGMFLNFEITDIKPEYSQATSSANDVLRLTAANPFAAAMDAGNEINVYFNVANFDLDQAFLGGIYTDDQADFTNLVSNATFNFYVQDDEGSVSYNGILYSVLTGYEIELGTALDTANFADGTVNGRIMQFTVVPEPSSALLVLIAGGAALTRRRRQPTA